MVTISDAIPLFHSHTLAPCLEAATQMIDMHDGQRYVRYLHPARVRVRIRVCVRMRVRVRVC